MRVCLSTLVDSEGAPMSGFQVKPVLTFGLLLLAILQVGSFSYADGEGSLRTPNELKGTEIIDKRGASVPADIQLTNHRGEKVDLSSYFDQKNKKPVILTLGYYQCPMLCNLVLNGLLDSLKTMSLKVGSDFRLLSVSINPNETADLAQNKRSNYLKGLSWPDDSDWNFYVGEESEIRRLADAVGFQYRYDKRSKEYVHSAGIFFVSPDGILSRTLYGINYKSSDVKMSLIDASHHQIGSLVDRVILSCFHYDPDSHRYGVYVIGVMRLGGLLTILIVGVMLFLYWRSEKHLTMS